MELLPELEKEAKERQLASLKQNQNTVEPKSAQRGRATTQAAQKAGTGKTGVKEMKKVKEEYPDLYKQIRAGTLTLEKAKRIIKKRRQEVTQKKSRIN